VALTVIGLLGITAATMFVIKAGGTATTGTAATTGRSAGDQLASAAAARACRPAPDDA
jgi:hypothetical protein